MGGSTGVQARCFPGPRRLRECAPEGAPCGRDEQGGAFTAPLLAKSGLAAYFEAVVTADQVGTRKPHPEPFLHACQALAAAPAEALVVGDSANEEARAAGCRVLLFRTATAKAATSGPSTATAW